MSNHIIQLRLSPADVEVFERGIHVEFVRLARGVDGVYEVEVEGQGTSPLPDSSAKPEVPTTKDPR